MVTYNLKAQPRIEKWWTPVDLEQEMKEHGLMGTLKMLGIVYKKQERS